jgi:dTDP-4-dehydrorhamnose reductase
MKNKILIIGNRKGFVASHIFSYFKKKKTQTFLLNFKNFIIKDKKYFSRFDLIINTSTDRKFIKTHYSEKNDRDLLIAKKIKEIDSLNFVMLSSRKIYKTGVNIKEDGKIEPKCFYSKNNLKAEINIKKILNEKRILILRISNLIGYNPYNPKKVHHTFASIFFEHIKKNEIFDPKLYFKDFITVNKFCEMVLKLIKKNAHGIYNISIGKKIYLKDIIKWLNFYNPKKFTLKTIKNNNVECFTLSNKKLLNFISIKNNQIDLKRECLNLSKKFFKKV